MSTIASTRDLPSTALKPFSLANSEFVVAGSVILILFVMVVPLPTFMLDMLLATNIALSLGVLLTAFYASRPLDFAIFPGLLLVTTLFRLSLNVASTRLILSQADAGALISAFGNIVVSGNYVVGSIIFLVLVVINFVVITKGSTRIAEVGARFTLDALPGKQMSIDADLNAGLIDEQEAKKRREEITQEADFYGAMDGASKFVRGDAIAALVITAINIIGGLVIGVAQRDMTFADSASTYTILSIGDGLVSQIPALLISTAAGIIVSRASGDTKLALEVRNQLFERPYPLLITGSFLAVLGLVPGLPVLPFFLLSAGVSYLGWHRLQEDQAEAKEIAALQEAQEQEELEPATEPTDLLLVDPLELEIGYTLISIVDPDQQGDLLERVKTLRKQLALELGVVIPPVRIRDNAGMESNRYVIKLRGNPIGEGEVFPNYHLALLPENAEETPPGIRTEDPTFGLPAVWVNERDLADAEQMGLTVVEAPAVITTHLHEVLRKNAHRLLDRQEVKKLIDKVEEESPALIDELMPDLLTLGQIQKVLKRLLRERVPIRDLVTILEALADHAPETKNVDVLTEYTRAAMAPTITRQFRGPNGTILAFVLDSMLEQHLLERAGQGELNANTLGMDPDRAERFITQADEQVNRLISQGRDPVLLTSPVLRATLFDFLNPMLSDINVLSYNDLVPEADIEVVGQIQLS